ncbi:MAG: PepSY domain-containing protein [Steroidobacteraceae bacterium]
MSSTLALPLLCLALVAGMASSTGALASDRHRERDRGDDRAFADRTISLDEAVARAERRYNARAVRAEEKRKGDRIEYRIRLLGEDGRVFEVRVDAGSGRED